MNRFIASMKAIGSSHWVKKEKEVLDTDWDYLMIVTQVSCRGRLERHFKGTDE